MPPDELTEKKVYRAEAGRSMRVTYPESLAERLRPFKPYINISVICCKALEEYLDTLDALPDDIKARLKDVPTEDDAQA
jgi:hypothetical protein